MLIAYVKSFSIKVWWEGADFFPLCGIEIGGWSGQQFGGNEVFIVQV